MTSLGPQLFYLHWLPHSFIYLSVYIFVYIYIYIYFYICNIYDWDFPDGPVVKTLPAMQETQEIWVQSLGWKDPLKKETAAHSVFLPGEFCGQRSLAGYSPKG